MKKIIIAALMAVSLISISSITRAQVNVQVNIGNQPAWGPSGYDYASYYYFPDYNFYFDVSSNQYIIPSNNKWVYVKTVPARYQFDPYNAYKAVVKQSKPYLYNKSHISEYAKFKGQGSKQGMIRDSKEEKYFESKGHPRHDEWSKKQPSNNNDRSGNDGKKTTAKGNQKNNR